MSNNGIHLPKDIADQVLNCHLKLLTKTWNIAVVINKRQISIGKLGLIMP